jgi:hypothetical protein
MTDEQLETVDGYVEDRPPETQVVSVRGRDRYHEVDDDGNPCCVVPDGSGEVISLRKAINRWDEPCQNDRCTRKRERGSIPDTPDGKLQKLDTQESLFFATNGWQDREKLYMAYWEYYWSSNQIAEWVGVHPKRVRELLRSFDIPIRDLSTANRVKEMKASGVPCEQIREQIGAPESTENVGDDTMEPLAD